MATPDSNLHDPNVPGGPADAAEEREQAAAACGTLSLRIC